MLLAVEEESLEAGLMVVRWQPCQMSGSYLVLHIFSFPDEQQALTHPQEAVLKDHRGPSQLLWHLLPG